MAVPHTETQDGCHGESLPLFVCMLSHALLDFYQSTASLVQQREVYRGLRTMNVETSSTPLTANEITDCCVMSIHTLNCDVANMWQVYFSLVVRRYFHNSPRIHSSFSPTPPPLLSDMIYKHWRIVYFRKSLPKSECPAQILEFGWIAENWELILELKLWNWSLHDECLLQQHAPLSEMRFRVA